MGKYYIPKNTAYLYNASALSGDYKLVSREDYTGIKDIETKAQSKVSKGTYTLSGIPVDSNKVLRPGVYIKDGKKVVIR